ncbi:MAG: 2-C-methyl-D-erythritol 2,4-cyclodiphosphate synthase [Firmicutes bacterium HGW-Firmicutes-12]|jgi:2-C-methyl-D-erythritol 2,4-cyclodiphosphate synthase|nr:MAG: 2-C-methyl-D-erythritol 2,4-cyclodiphosphate synthase [Firmicutes bacterium HGW-Firmicutes-12]
MRIGFGYDVHKLTEGRRLVLGGVEIPSEKGLLGHSDADVLIHAVMDALLGAAGLGDIGLHFPDNKMEYKDIDSRKLLEIVIKLLQKKGYVCNNLDCTIVAQYPKLAPFREEMRESICNVLGMQIDSVNIKATTTEGLGFVGREEGIAAYVVCTIDEYPIFG